MVASDSDYSRVLEFIKDYFVILSAAAVAVGAMLAIIFLYGYLKVFDWHLFWIVQYQDILTFALIAVALLCGSSFLIAYIASGIVDAGLANDRPKWGYVVSSVVLFLLLVAVNVYDQSQSKEPHYARILYGAAAVLLGIVAIWVCVRTISLRRWPGLFAAALGAGSVSVGAYAMGAWLGHSVLEDRSAAQDIYLKDETFIGAKIVMAMSHHTIFYVYKDGSIYVVPTEDVRRIVSVRDGGNRH